MTPRYPAVLLTALALAACGGAAPASHVEDLATGPDLAQIDCSSPCACVDRGPPKFAGEADGVLPAEATEDDVAAMVRSNHWRTAAGLKALNGNLLLEQAAYAHARYLAGNNRGTCWPDPHTETKVCSGYTGDTVGEREYATGYRYSRFSEVINWETFTAAAVDRWLWSVYHRMPYMDYRLLEGAYASESTNNVMDFGTGTVPSPKPPAVPPVFPVPGDIDVPPDFRGDLEEPSPPAPGGGGAWPSGVSSGQVISVHFGGQSGTVTEHHLYSNAGGACEEMPHTLIDKETDPTLAAFQSNDVFLYSDEVLASGTEFVVILSGTYMAKPFTRSWAFTTAQ